MKFKKAFYIYLVLTLILDLVFFGAAYFFNKVIPQRYYLYVVYVPFALISLGSFFNVKIVLYKKIAAIAGFFVIGAVSAYIFIVMSMFIPGSKEHNYVMYSVCLPALRKHYESKGKIYSLVNVPNNKGWEEHERCEQNVWSGREPLAGIK